ncbi:unnamed protein product [Cylicocyclus nassatus]|uniref:Uncharacterized protein n=1 Tax=Cylicocyclus nassatus TaxID=53992 RepID=A0AA36DRM3_CYLNA|nr:unnamed protein product [Cylicocyclus nassatus]
MLFESSKAQKSSEGFPFDASDFNIALPITVRLLYFELLVLHLLFLSIRVLRKSSGQIEENDCGYGYAACLVRT